MIASIVLVAMGSVVLFLSGWFGGVAHQRARERALVPGRAGQPRDGLRADPAPSDRRATVRQGRYRPRPHIPYGPIDLED